MDGKVSAAGTFVQQKRAQKSPRKRSWTISLVELIGAVLWLGFCCSLLLRILSSPAARSWILTISAILAGVCLSDFMSGFLHWLFDTFFEENTRVFGPYLIGPFREHHRDPRAMTHHSFLELTGNSFLAYLPALALIWWLGPSRPQTPFGVFNYTWWLSFTIALTLTNQLHCWAHRSSPPRLALWLQRCGLAISQSRHAAHHAPPHRTAYCITNGWTNRLADRISFFAHLEKLFVACGVPRTRQTN